MLTAEQRAEIRSIIEAEIENLEASLVDMKEQTKPVTPDASVGRLSRMDQMVNMGTVELAMGEAQKRLERLREKLGKIDEPDFGRCPMCTEMITMERLRVAPERGVCVQCLNKSRAGKR